MAEYKENSKEYNKIDPDDFQNYDWLNECCRCFVEPCRCETPRKEKNMMKAETVAKYIAKAVIKRKRTLIFTISGKISIFLIKVYPKIIERIMYNQMRKEHDSPLK
jgi:hypothetical protein